MRKTPSGAAVLGRAAAESGTVLADADEHAYYPLRITLGGNA